MSREFGQYKETAPGTQRIGASANTSVAIGTTSMLASNNRLITFLLLSIFDASHHVNNRCGFGICSFTRKICSFQVGCPEERGPILRPGGE
jgi:hypothetical protein